MAETSHPRGLLDLPTELLTEICQHLCLHCQNLRVVDQPQHIVDSAHHDQRTLARLSLTCTVLRDVAQPVLFHFFHIGDILPKADGSPRPAPVDSIKSWHRIQSFLRAAVSRSDLSLRTKELALSKIFYENASQASQTLIGRYLRDDLIDLPGIKSFPCDRLDVLAMVLFPNLEALLGAGGTTGERNWGSPHPSARPLGPSLQWSSLKYFVSASGFDINDNPPHLFDIVRNRSILGRAPKLEVLIAPDCGGNDFPSRSFPGETLRSLQELRMENLRVFSVSGLQAQRLVQFLPCCPHLEDLEIYQDTYGTYPFPRFTQFEPVKHTLRRLCYSITTIQALALQIHHVDDEIWEPGEDEDATDNEPATDTGGGAEDDAAEDMGFGYENSFAENDAFDASGFPVLEILETEQLILYGNLSQKGPERLMSRLPQSLRILHIGMVVAWPELRRDLTKLALVANQRFPSLRIVHVDKHGKNILAEEIHGMELVMKQAGITFRVGKPPRSSSPRGMLGPRPGCPEIWRHPSQLYRLDSSMRVEGY